MSWFEDQGFISRAEARADGGNRGTTEPVNTTMPAGGAVNTTQPVGQPVAGPTAGAAQPFSEGLLQEILHRYPPTNDGMRAAMQEIDRTFGAGVVQLLDHPTKLDKLRLPNGVVVDTIGGAGGPNPSWAWQPEGAGGGAAGGAVGALGGAIGGNAMAGIDPSYEWRFKEGQKALERSAAAKGTLLTGGTLKALAQYGQGLASTEFGNIFDRNYRLAGLGLNAAQSAAQTGSTYGGNLGQLADSQSRVNADLTTGAGNAQATGTATGANIWGNTIGNLGGAVAGPLTDWWQQRQSGTGGGPLPATFQTYQGVPFQAGVKAYR